VLAIIPARGGSKGLPNKNILRLAGKPLIQWTIDAAIKSKYIDRIILSTDNEIIANTCRTYGIENPFMRPVELAQDDSLAIDNYIYTIDRLNDKPNCNIKDFIVLQPTSPLRLTEDIDKAIELFYNKNADSVISYTEENHPIEWHKYLTNDGKFEKIFEEVSSNRQDNKVSFYPNGSIFIFKYDLIKQKKYYSADSFAFIMPRKRSIDIDTIDDFEYAEYLMLKNG